MFHADGGDISRPYFQEKETDMKWIAVNETGFDNFATSIYENDYKGLLVARCNQNGQYPDQARMIIRALEFAHSALQVAKEVTNMKTEYQIGDNAWIYLPGHDGNRTLGVVVFILDLPGWSVRNYVIEIDTPMDPLLEIREAGAMRPVSDPVTPECDGVHGWRW